VDVCIDYPVLEYLDYFLYILFHRDYFVQVCMSPAMSGGGGLLQTSATGGGATQFGSFSPGGASGPPPPAHQSPRHISYVSHPLPAHFHHPIPHSPPGLLSSSSLVPATISSQLLGGGGAPVYVSSPSHGSGAAYPASPQRFTGAYKSFYRNDEDGR